MRRMLLVLLVFCLAGVTAFGQTAIPLTYFPKPLTPERLDDAVSGATTQSSGSFLGFPSKAEYHMVAGWASTGLLFTAGVIGAVRAVDLMTKGHELRKSLGIHEENDPALTAALADLWSGNQTLRWVHVGLLATGETLYLGNAITGLSMKLPTDSRNIKSDIHFYSFLVHAGLMLTEATLGLLTTNALKTGNHEAHLSFTVAHAVIGVAIPVVMTGAGLAITTNVLTGGR